MNKRKNSFRDEFKKEFKNIKRSFKGVHFAHCNVCDREINLEAIGKTAISVHNDTQKHKKMCSNDKFESIHGKVLHKAIAAYDHR